MDGIKLITVSGVLPVITGECAKNILCNLTKRKDKSKLKEKYKSLAEKITVL